ncbi:Porin-like protein NicP [Pseudomonas reidholzensis]|uniref:Porin-like protein NicP n=1 Tax=Pseudomonas reidholzensis TaxID=1785162 RepID=A0A383RMS9_9PSED|nr:OprD family porin [Pseudomonas reidholzensis]SYX88053.1 Porin-like protein NicP [Pseudomonas reidholzensis]
MPRASSRIALTLLTALAVSQAQADDPGWSLLSRNYLLHNDYRSPTGSGQSYRQEWAQGFIGELRSGFTAGTVGVGIDAHAFLGLKLDGGRGHAGTGLLPRDSDGRAESDYSSAGAALKLRLGNTLLRYGEMTVETPVFDTGDKRLHPEYATGWLLENTDLADWRLQAGRFTAFNNQDNSSSHDDFSGVGATTHGHAISLAGATYAPDGPFGGALYASQLEDTWRQGYLNLNLAEGNWRLDGNLYHTRDSGQASAGAIDTRAYSLAAKYRRGAQALTLAYQKIDGDTPFDFVGGDSIYLANSIKYADFNGPNERSWQLRYDLDMATLGVPGLSLMGRYVTGRGIDGTHAPAGGAYVAQQGHGGRHWERDLDLKYVVQSGTAKDLSLSLSHVSHRANSAQAGDDIDRLYLIIEYPLKGSF